MTSKRSPSEASEMPADPATRPLPALAQRVLMIGLDGATFDILRPLMEEGRMPCLKRLVDEGASGILMSTIPPITPAAWTTFLTGKNPGKHGIFDFERYNVHTNELTFNSVYDVRHRTIWDILGQQGLRVGSIQIPMTYPPRAVNGFLISGFETPGTDVDFTYPVELKQELLSRWPEFTFKTRWNRRPFGGIKLFKENLLHIKKSFDQGVNLARFCGDKYGWDAMMVLYKLVDNLQHKTWKYLDPNTAHRDPTRARLAAECFEHLDRCIEQLVDYAVSNKATVLIMSDHGHGALEGKIQANMLLKQWNYLSVDSTAQVNTRTRHTLHRLFSKKRGRFAANYSIEHDLAIDWNRTQAFVAHAGMCGFLYLNLKGRQQTGIVEPSRYDALRAEIANKLLKVRVQGPRGHKFQIFEKIYRPEDLYQCSREQYEWLPDLMLVPHQGLTVVRKIRSQHPVIWSSWRKLEGTHRPEGILIASGHHIARTQRAHGQMADVAPTLLSMMGVPVPDDMDGKVLQELFTKPLDVAYESSQAASAHSAPPQAVFSQEEEALLSKRLSDLGYLE